MYAHAIEGLDSERRDALDAILNGSPSVAESPAKKLDQARAQEELMGAMSMGKKARG